MITNVRLFDLVTGILTPTDIAICGDTIVGTTVGDNALQGKTVTAAFTWELQ